MQKSYSQETGRRAKTAVEDLYPLTPMQQGMLFHSLYAPASGTYIEQFTCVLHGQLDRAAFTQAWQHLIDRYAILRSACVWEGIATPLQVVLRKVQAPLAYYDWRGLNPQDQDERLRAFLESDHRQDFTLAQAPLLRLALLQTADDTHHFVWTHHHLLLDGWSVARLIASGFSCYNALARGCTPQLPPARPFREYLTWLQQQDLAQAEQFWRATLEGFTVATPMQVDRQPSANREAGQTYAQATRTLDGATLAALQGLARQQQLTLNTLLQGAWSLLLSRYSGEADVLFGAVVAGRPASLVGVETMVGLFTNVLPVRVRVPPSAPLGAWLAELQAQQREARRYEYSPLLQVQGWSTIPHGQPLFETVLVFENHPWTTAELEPELQLVIADAQLTERTHYPLTLMVNPAPALLLTLSYDGARFEAATITRLLGHLETLLRGMAEGPAQHLAALPLLNAAERAELLHTANGVSAPYPSDTHLAALLVAQAARTPDRLALFTASQALTYQALATRSAQLAHYLLASGAAPEVPVGLYLERSLDALVALLAIWSAGAVLVPLDPTAPPAHTAAVLAATELPLLLTTAALRVRLPAHPMRVVCLDADAAAIARCPTCAPVTTVGATHLSHIIYTSGSTGLPKGVAVPQQQLLNRVSFFAQAYPFTEGEVACQRTPLTFSVALAELLTPLLHGVPSLLVPDTLLAEPQALLAELERQHVTRIVLVPTLLRLLLPALEALPAPRLLHLQLWSLCGEVLSPELVARLHTALPHARLLHQYGASEINDVALYEANTLPAEAERVPLGRPLANTQLYVLDAHGQLAPLSVPGELHIGGAGLARGYHRRPDLTAERFVPNPFGDKETRRQGDKETRSAPEPQSSVLSPQSSARLYRTGDLVRYRADGQLEYLGRIDAQVKLRGVRVDLAGIEALLRQHTDVAQAAVLARELPSGELGLVAYVVTSHKSQVTSSEESSLITRHSSLVTQLRSFLAARLPAALLPALFVTLDALPRTSSGKIDRRALAAQPLPTAAEQEEAAPRTPLEELVANVWSAVLGVERISRHDHFFALGGHSLLATQVVARLRASCGVELPLRTLFESPTLAALAEQVARARDDGSAAPAPPLVAVSRDGALPLSYAQQRLWFLDQLNPGQPFYNVPAAVELLGPLDIAQLAASLSAVVARHEVLRTSFVAQGGRPHQQIERARSLPLRLCDLQAFAPAVQAAAVARLGQVEARERFDLARGPLLRATLLRLDAAKHVLLLTMHHIVADGWSTGVLVRELAALYTAGVSGTRAALPNLPLQYADYAVWQRAWLEGAQGSGVRGQGSARHGDKETRRQGDKESEPSAEACPPTPNTQHPTPLQAQLTYWQRQLAGLPTLELPSDRVRPPQPSFRGAVQSFHLPPPLATTLKALSRRESVTLFMTLLGAFQVLLARYSGETDIVVGTRIAGRTRAETENLIGFFVNALVLRTDLAGNPTIREVLARVREVCLGAYAHQDLPFEQLVEELHADRDLSRHPLFQVMFALQNFPIAPIALPDLELQPILTETQTAKFDLDISMTEADGMIVGMVEYSVDLFEAATITRLLGHLETLLKGMAEGPAQHLAELPLLNAAERAELLHTANGVSAPYPSDAHLAALLVAQAARTPDRLALFTASQALTYQALAARTHQLAHYLLASGAAPEVPVGLYLERSLDALVALLAIWSAGAVLVPLDVAAPPAHTAAVLAATELPLLLTTATLRVRLPAHPMRVVCLDADAAAIARCPTCAPVTTVGAAHLSHIIYTSGSTGQPKGVAVPQQQLLNRVSFFARAYPFTEGEVACQRTPLTFSVALAELLTPLLHGVPSLLVPDTLLAEPQALLAELERQHVTRIVLVPTLLRLLLPALDALPAPRLPHLQLWSLCGEVLPPELVARLHTALPHARLLHQYGASEINDVALFEANTLPPEAERVPLGRPLANTQLYVLDAHGQLAPLSVPGELHIGGAGLARGYHRRPDLTAEKFIPNPFATDKETRRQGDKETGDAAPVTQHPTPNTRLYRTGDLARYRADGQLEYLGRIDAQIKLRGVRVDLAGIEALLRQHESVAQAAVLARELPSGELGLVAYVVQGSGVRGQGSEARSPGSGVHGQERTGSEGSDSLLHSAFCILHSDELRAFLAARLPAALLPALFVVLDALPRTSSGKIDRRALAAQVLPTAAEQQEAAPRTPLEELVANVWSAVLGVERISRHDHFFALGGHSLLATQVVARLRASCGVELPLRTLFESPTLAALAEQVARARDDGSAAPPLIVVRRDGALPLSYAQQRLWFLDQLNPGQPFYNVPAAVELLGPLDIAQLAASLSAVVARHEVLRTSFVAQGGRPHQQIERAHPLPLRLCDLQALAPAAQDAAVARLGQQEARERFDLARGPLLRATLLRRASEAHVLLLTMHHIVADGWSTGVLVRELAALYTAGVSGTRAALPNLPLQYADYAVWQREWLQGSGVRGLGSARQGDKETRRQGDKETDVDERSTQNSKLKTQNSPLEAQLAYWQRQLAGLPTLELPSDRPRSPQPSFRGAVQSFHLPPPLATALTALSRQEGSTLFMTLLAGVDVLLARYSRQHDIVVGTPIANRRWETIERLIGCFINTLVLRADLSGDPSFRELLARVREVCLGAYAHQDLPFEQLVEELQPERDLNRHPLFQVMFVMQNAPMPALELPGLALRPMATTSGTLQFDLSLNLVETPDGLYGELEYRIDLFAADMIARMVAHLQTLLEGAVAEPGRRLSELPLLSEAELRQVLLDWNATQVAYLADACLHELFEAQAARTPDSLAVVFGGQGSGVRGQGDKETKRQGDGKTDSALSPQSSVLSPEQLTYHELKERANRLAHHLHALGVGPEVLVGICLERSVELLVGLLAILKAGGAYVPFDPSYPPERLAFMLEDSRVAVLITTTGEIDKETRRQGDKETEYADDVTVSPRHRVTPSPPHLVTLSETWPSISEPGAVNPVVAMTPDQLAYVIYTSGSTGQPKGVMNTHRGIVNRLLWMQDAYHLTAADRVLHKTPFSFDVSVWELFWPLLNGATLVLARPGGHQEPDYLARLIGAEGITTLHFVPSLLQVFLEQPDLTICGSLRRVISSGEALAPELQERFFARLEAQLHNLYGPTEAAVDVTAWACERASDRERVPIGRPIANTQTYVLDAALRPVPIGVAGELYLGGVQLARGYLGRPELTAAAFIPNPFLKIEDRRLKIEDSGLAAHESLSSIFYPLSSESDRLYKTGDLARYRPDGAIEYLGRLDEQVKLRGFRIELGEIAAVLSQHEAVRAAVVTLREDAPGDKRLVAYIVPKLEDRGLKIEDSQADPPERLSSIFYPLSSELRAFLQSRLPDYMIPAAFVVLDALPLTPSGKVDRRALPAPDHARPQLGRPFVAPRTPTEATLAALWGELLRVDQIGIEDNFFELGGHSLLLTQLIFRIREAFRVELPLRALFDARTIVEMTVAITEKQVEAENPDDVVQMLRELRGLSPEEIKVLLEEDSAI